MPLILRAIITGFGYKLGSELARYIATRAGLIDKETAGKDSKEEVIPEGVTHVDEPIDGNRRGRDDDDGHEPES